MHAQTSHDSQKKKINFYAAVYIPMLKTNSKVNPTVNVLFFDAGGRAFKESCFIFKVKLLFAPVEVGCCTRAVG